MSQSRQRALRLLLLLLDGDGHTMEALQEALDGAAPRSIRYDMDAMDAVGLTVERIQSSGGERAGRQPTCYRLSAEARELLSP